MYNKTVCIIHSSLPWSQIWINMTTDYKKKWGVLLVQSKHLNSNYSLVSKQGPSAMDFIPHFFFFNK